jgi:hypothetical protein
LPNYRCQRTARCWRPGHRNLCYRKFCHCGHDHERKGALHRSAASNGLYRLCHVDTEFRRWLGGRADFIHHPASCHSLRVYACVDRDVTTSAGSCATTVVKINGTAFSGTSTHLVAFGASIIPVDSGIVDTAAGLLAACTGCAPLVSPSFTTPALGAATATSLLSTGIVDGEAPVTITSGTTANLGATYNSGYTLNQEGTAGTGVTYTLPATATGKQYCVKNSGTTSIVNVGVLTVYPASGSYVILKGVVNTVGGGGTHGVASGGAADDAACFVAIDSTHWQVFIGAGTWTEN